MNLFLDTNILISGIFFRGNEAKLLQIPGLKLITAEIVIKELNYVVMKKFRSLKAESLRIAYDEIAKAIKDIEVINDDIYIECLPEATRLVTKRNDQHILAAVLYSKSDCFITGDKHFQTEKVKNIISVKTTREILTMMKIV